MELALVGVTGKLGSYLHEHWASAHRVHAFGRDRMDLRDSAAVRRILQDAQFDTLVNCAAVASPEACEADPDEARLVNTEAPGAMAEMCRRKGARMVHFSTDYVLDGTEPGLKDEGAPTGPVNHYGRTKLAGEHRVLEACPTAAVCRVSWVFGTEPSGFLEAILNRARNGEALEAVADKWSMPTSAREIRKVVEMLVANPDLSGVFHVAHEGEPESWWSYGRKVLEMAEELGLIQPGWEIKPTKLSEIPQLSAPRQVHTAMTPGRLVRELGWRIPSWESAAREELGRLWNRESH
jgi:dTDP-4-dehydrorhamnose reductase